MGESNVAEQSDIGTVVVTGVTGYVGGFWGRGCAKLSPTAPKCSSGSYLTCRAGFHPIP